ncbi:Na(+)/H(+) exchange regulatory cofactor NHE-RF1 [Ambystoma mexicanum]|uniref:Na(+)/H(+) exchange regulatory cofactor NHE-RF1 n=1 Tax=Ambystoma mexicanum TaxID=8296 RepID=UPI0037E7D4B1
MAGPAEELPRLCCLEKGPDGYGFHLHGQKDRQGQFIRLVESGSAASSAGLRPADRLVEVNGHNVETESHQQVVERIRAAAGTLRLLVVDPDADERLKSLGIPCTENLIRGLPGDRATTGLKGAEEDGLQKKGPSHKQQEELRPRLCCMKKGPNGYGFNLHSDKAKPGQYVRAVDPDSPAEASGLKAQDRIVEVNGVCMEGKQHSDVVTAIKVGGDETRLLVVDLETDEYFKKCKVTPSSDHVTGALPELVANGDAEEKVSAAQIPSEVVLESPPSTPRPSSTASTASTPDEPDGKENEDIPEGNTRSVQEPQNTTADSDLDLNMSLAIAKERARQKRSQKKAPPMDWSKKNELFSNL